MHTPPPKPSRSSSLTPKRSFQHRAAWARELGRCDAFDDVLAIWENADRELALARVERDRVQAEAARRSRAETRRSMLYGAFVLLLVALPVAQLAHAGLGGDALTDRETTVSP